MKKYQYGFCLPSPTVKVDPASDILNACARVIDAGFDYAEGSMSAVSGLSESDFLRLVSLRPPIKACNCFLPGELKIISEDALNRGSELTEYVKRAFERAERLGVEVIVFGSGKSREIPEGMTYKKGLELLKSFLEYCSPLAQSHHLTLAIEPLRADECNIINTTDEGEALALSVGGGVSYIADTFHTYCQNEPADALCGRSTPPAHIHIAEPPKRLCPNAESGEYLRKFAEGLKRTEFCGKISVECSYKDFDSEAPKALAFMREVFE